MITKKKIEAYDFGLFAEEVAAQKYIQEGYTILERRWKLGKTEIDLIVQKDDVIVIVEVKARKTNEDDAILSVTPDKRRRMIKAADVYLRKQIGSCDYRFDIVAVAGSQEQYKVAMIKDAFVATDLF